MIQVIQPADVLFEKLVLSPVEGLTDKQPTFTGKVRMMKYVILQPVDNGILLFNAITCELILTDEELLNSETLRKKWFVVPENFDEKRLVTQLRPIMKSFHQHSGVTSYTILTTTDCNARCFYCYEKGSSRISMTKETADKVSSFIIDNAFLDHKPSTCKPRPVSLKWFGGEPLYNLQVIDYICDRLRKADVPYRSSMTSNCYLFTPEVVDRAKSLWNLKHVQVTLDGTEDVYNRIKAYTNTIPSLNSQLSALSSQSPYQRVMRNIQLLLDAGIHVDIRMNLDKHNADNLTLLAEELKERFATPQHLKVYSHVIFQEDGPLENALNDKLNDRLMQYGLLSLPPLPKEMPQYFCMADNDNAVVITPTGDLERCEHLTHADFTERAEDTELCDDCPYYPLCIRLKGCPQVHPEHGRRGIACDEHIRSRHIKLMQQKMVLAANTPLQPAGFHEAQRLKEHLTPNTQHLTPDTPLQVFPILDEYVAIGANKEIIHLNEIGKEIFEMYVSGKTNEQIVAALLEEYDASECELSDVVRPFTVKLSQIVP